MRSSSSVERRHRARREQVGRAVGGLGEPVGGVSAGASTAAGSADAGCSGSTSVNVEPSPGVDCDADLAAEQARDLARDRQAQAGAAVLARRRAVGLLEGLEDQRAACPRGMPTPVSMTANAEAPVLRRADAQRHRALVGELERVGEQVAQHLLQALLVGDERRRQLAVDARS